MKIRIIIIILCFYSLTSFSQQLRLKLTYPSPRQGDEMVISVTFENPDSTYPIEGVFTFKQCTKDIGFMTIGPVSLKINGTHYTSNSLRIKVIEKLPDVASGFWLRTVKENNKEYLILEERVARNKKKPITTDTLYYGNSKDITKNRMTMTGSEFAALNYYAKKVPGLEFDYLNYSNASQYIGNKDNMVESYYQITIYKIEKDKSFKGKFILDKNYFVNLPLDCKLPEIIIEQ